MANFNSGAALGGIGHWGPEVHRTELVAAIESTLLTLIRSALPRRASASKARQCSGAVDAVGPADAVAGMSLQLLGLLSGQSAKRAGKSGAMRLCRVLAVMDSVHSLLMSGRHGTSRELFYSHVALFNRQKCADDVVKGLCRALKVPRHYLRIVGTAKGLVRGHLRLWEPSTDSSAGVWVDCFSALEPRGHIISPMCAHLLRAETTARTILVVEKETVFHRLLKENFLERHRPCVVITARGFPDIPTRYLLRRIRQDCASPRVLLLMDFDAFGLAIAATYAFGPEDVWMQDDLELPESVPLLCSDRTIATSRYGLGAEDALALTARDHAVANGLLKRFLKLRERLGEELMRPWEGAARKLLEVGEKWELDAMDRLSDFVDAGMRGNILL